jgi:hypothetical protein
MAETRIPKGYKLVPDTAGAYDDLKPRMEPGKAAAFDRWMAQGGGLIDPSGNRPGSRRATYRQGPMKGMTFDQAFQKFESMWGNASPEIRAKYNARATGQYTPATPAGSSVAPRPAATTPSTTTARKPVNPAATVGAGRGSAVKVGGAGDLSREAMGSEAAQAEVARQLAEGGMFATADAGGGASMAASQEMYRRNQAQDEALRRGIATPDEIDSVKADEAKQNADAIAKREAEIQAAKQAEIDKTRGAAGLTQPTEPAVSGGSTSAKQPTRAEQIAAASGDTSKMPTDDRMVVEGKTNLVPGEKADALADQFGVPAEQITASTPVMKQPPGPRENSATGKITPPAQRRLGPTPAGQELVGMAGGQPIYKPVGEVYAGTSAAKPGASDADIRAAYQARMRPTGPAPAITLNSQGEYDPRLQRTPASKPTMARGPASRPDPVFNAPRSDGYQARSPMEDIRLRMNNERAARAAAGSMQADPAGLRLVGPKKPLDQLVANNPPRAIPIQYPSRR